MAGTVTPFPSLPARRDGKPPVEEFRPFYASEMEGRRPLPREWIIDGVLQRQSVMLFAGPAKIGKSLLLQQMLTATAAGLPWMTRETVRVNAFGLFTEDPQNEIEIRQELLNSHYDVSPADFELGYGWKSLAGQDAILVEFERYSDRPKLTPLWHQFWNYIRDEGHQLVGLDNARVLFGGNENFPTQVTAFVRLLVQKAIEIDGAIVLAAHPAKNDARGYAGTGAWLASVRSGMSLHRPRDYDEEVHGFRDARRLLVGLGSNYGAGIGTERVDIRDGVFHVGERDDLPRKREALNHTERQDLRYRMLIGLKRVLNNGGRVPADEEDPKGMPHRARRSDDSSLNRMPLNDLNRGQQELIDAGQVVRVEVGRRCYLRPADGPYYADESPWVSERGPSPKPAPEPAKPADTVPPDRQEVAD